MSKIKLTCQNAACGCEFETEFKHRNKKYCSRTCYFADSNCNAGKRKTDHYYEDRVCIICGSTFNVRKKTKKTMCSDVCRKIHYQQNKDEFLKLSREAVENKYGVSSAFLLKEVQEKIAITNIKKYGHKTPSKNKDVKNKMVQTNLKKYGVEYTLQSECVKQKAKEKIKERFGVDFITQNKDIQKKIKQTNNQKFGVSHPMKNDNIKQQVKQTNWERYGVEYPTQSEGVKQKTRSTVRENFGVDFISQNPNIRDKINETLNQKRGISFTERANHGGFTLLEIISSDFVFLECNTCKHVFQFTQMKNNKIPICRKCHPVKIDSSLNLLFKEQLDGVRYKTNDRKIITPHEIDFLLLDDKLGFEINGNYWHSEYYGGKDKYYHLNKTQNAFNCGIQLIHIFEDEILDKIGIVKSRIKNKLGLTVDKIYARNCEIRTIDHMVEKNFLNLTHIQGYVRSKYKLGLFYNNELVSVMTFGNRVITKTKPEEIELLRFSSKLNTVVVGGFSKLFNHFIKTTTFSKVITYSDIRWGGLNNDNNVYTKNGFRFVKQTPPNYWYIKISKVRERKHRFAFRKDVLVKMGFDANKTESVIMFERGYDKIWDCGSLKYEFIMNEETITPTSVVEPLKQTH